VADAVGLVGFAAFLAAAGLIVWRRPVAALYVFAVGLAAHNAVMAALFAAGVRGHTLSLIILWKEFLLVVALARIALDAWRERRLPFRPGHVDALALAFAAIVLLYGLLPQGPLDGRAGFHARVYALHHDYLILGGYLLGRSLRLDARELRRLAATVLATAAVLAGIGLLDDYLVPISWWRDSKVPAFFRDQLGYDYHGTGNLPENFIYNVGGDKPFLRRLVSLFLSPLASSYLFVVALALAAGLAATWRRRLLVAAASVLVLAGLLWTFARASVLALAVGLVVIAVAGRRRWAVVAAVAVVALGVGFAHAFTHIGPTGRFTKADLRYQHELAKKAAKTTGNSPLTFNESSIHSHITNLRAGASTVVHHPQGFGLGNAGTIASRFKVKLEAGESNYTELGVETGLLGTLIFIAWSLALLGGTIRAREVGIAGAFAAVLALALQTDIIGVPWVAFTVWPLAAAALSAGARARGDTPRPSAAPTRPS
jgi:hypothetical protein